MNISRRQFISLLGSSMLVPLLPGCLPCENSLTIASHVWLGYEFMFLARDEQWLPPSGLILKETRSASDSMKALLEGTVAGAALTLDEVLRVRSRGIPLTVVLVFDASAGADAVLARPGINEPADVVGKRIGYERSALGALMFQKLLEAAHLTPEQVTPAPMNIDHHLQAWQEERLDAVVTYEPEITKLEKLGAHRIFDSCRMPGMILNVLAVRSDLLSTYAESISDLVRAHFRGLHHLKTNRQDAVHRMAPRLGIPSQNVLEAYKGVELPDIRSNRTYLGEKSHKLRDVAGLLSSLMFKIQLLKKEDDLKDLCTDIYLPTSDLS